MLILGQLMAGLLQLNFTMSQHKCIIAYRVLLSERLPGEKSILREEVEKAAVPNQKVVPTLEEHHLLVTI